MNKSLKDAQGRSEEEFLANYKAKEYEKPSVTIDIIIITKTNPMHVLLIQRKQHPFIEQWAFPGGFVNMNEGLAQAARREVKEETNVDVDDIVQLHTYGDVHRDPRMRVISVAYLAQIDDVLSVCAGDDAKNAQWFQIEEKTFELHLYNKHAHIAYDLNKEEANVMDNYASLAFDHIHMLLDALHHIQKED